ALPGNYAIKVHYYGSRQQTLIGPTTMVATVFTNWGRPDEKREVLTLRLDSPRDMEEVGVVTIGPSGGAIATEQPAGRALAPFRALRRGMPAEQVTAARGQPGTAGGEGRIELGYPLADRSEVRAGLG